MKKNSNNIQPGAKEARILQKLREQEDPHLLDILLKALSDKDQLTLIKQAGASKPRPVRLLHKALAGRKRGYVAGQFWKTPGSNWRGSGSFPIMRCYIWR